jgi:hypothetical protein
VQIVRRLRATPNHGAEDPLSIERILNLIAIPHIERPSEESLTGGFPLAWIMHT